MGMVVCKIREILTAMKSGRKVVSMYVVRSFECLN